MSPNVVSPRAERIAPRTADRAPAVLLPAVRRSVPVATARRYRAVGATWTACAASALLAAWLDAPVWLQTAAAGLVLPGGGFLATGQVPIGAAVVSMFVIAVFVWWAIGALVLPPAVWLGAAVTAAAAAAAPIDHRAVLALVCGPVGATLATYAIHRFRHERQRRDGLAINRALARVSFPVTTQSSAFRRPLLELSEEDLRSERFAFDLALQPLDRFDGFVHLDQFREAALRYQLFFLGYTLSLAQYNATPAFSGYLAEAQRNAIEKVLDRRVWRYWALENAWGRLRLGRDPVDTVGNVMLTGYYGTQLGMYESLNDDRYSQPGALTFRWSDDTAYVHDFGSVAGSVIRNVEGSDYALYACEPGWVYSVCSAFALTTLIAHDRLHGQGLMARGGGRLRRGYETEFLRPDGKIIGMRSGHLGLTWNFWTGTVMQMTTAFWLHPSLPDLAQRAWWLLRPQLTIEDGLLRLPPTVSARLDPGNYSFGKDHYAMAIAEVAAREMGDAEVAAAARRSLDASTTVLRQGGVARHEGMSTVTLLYSMLGRWMQQGSLRGLVAFGDELGGGRGPRLAHADYPEVLVARAGTDGHAIELVLRPGAGAVRTRLTFDRLVARRRYRVTGTGRTESTVTTDDGGRAEVTLDLGGRTELRLVPV